MKPVGLLILMGMAATAAAALSEALKGKTALHLSDLHIEAIGPFEERLLEVVAGIAPDMVFLTDDYVPWGGDVAPALEFLSRLQAKDGVWAVMRIPNFCRALE